MHKLIALYKDPPNPEKFRDHYVNVHIPLLQKMPGVVRMNYTFDIKNPAGEKAYFCVFECYFRNAEDMVNGLYTPEGEAVLADLANYETGEYEIINFAIPDEP